MAKVLLVEDEKQIRKLVARLLSRMGHEVIQASDGQEGLDAVGHEQPELIVSDVLMPRMGGVKMVRILRSQGCPTPIILMSGFVGGDLGDVQALAEEGLICGLPLGKPLNPAQFAERVLQGITEAISHS